MHLFLAAAEWRSDYEEALRVSKENNQPLLLVFIGEEWCPWSQKLDAEVLSHSQFLQELDQFVLVRMNLAQFAGPEERVCRLKEKYQIQEIPSLVVFTSLGEEMARVGYMPLQPLEFATLFKEIKNSYEEISQADLKNLGIDKLKELYMASLKYGFNQYRYEILAAGLQLDKTPFFLLEKYKLLIEDGKMKKAEALAVRKELVKRDPKNGYGVHRTLAIVDFHKLSNRYRLRKKPDEVVKPLLDYIKKFGSSDEEHLWKIEMMIAQFYFSRDKVETALMHAERSYQVAPEAFKEEISQSIDFLKTKLG
jgi:thioredoxin-related protein